MIELVFLLEEISARVMLESFLPKIISSSIHLRFIVFEGKQDLEKQVLKRMKGYRVPNARFIILRDKDSEDCRQIKKRLVNKCIESGRSQYLVRIACHELESWYLGDLAAVEAGLKISGLEKQQSKAPFDNPDLIVSPSQKLKSMAPSYQKIGGSRAIGFYLDPNRNVSRSFGVFIKGIQKLIVQ